MVGTALGVAALVPFAIGLLLTILGVILGVIKSVDRGLVGHLVIPGGAVLIAHTLLFFTASSLSGGFAAFPLVRLIVYVAVLSLAAALLLFWTASVTRVFGLIRVQHDWSVWEDPRWSGTVKLSLQALGTYYGLLAIAYLLVTLTRFA